MISGIVVTHCARGQLNAVAHEVILERGDRKRIDLAALGLEDLRPPLGMENGLWQNSSSPDSSPISYIGKSTIQQNS